MAGAAFVFRQYLTDGWHPRGVKNVSNSMHARPSSALLKPCLSILCGPLQGPWLRTHMQLSLQLVFLVFHGYGHLLIFLCLGFNAAPHIPIFLPVQTNMKDLAVQNCLWIADAKDWSFSLYLRQNQFSLVGVMHTYTFSIANYQGSCSFGMQVKITMA